MNVANRDVQEQETEYHYKALVRQYEIKQEMASSLKQNWEWLCVTPSIVQELHYIMMSPFLSNAGHYRTGKATF